MTRRIWNPTRSLAGSTLLVCLPLLAALSGCASDEEKVAAYLAEAEVAREAGDYETEILELRSALQVTPSSAEINLLIADASRALGKLPNAAFYYQEAHRLDPTNTRAAMMFVSMIMSEEPDRAEEIIEKTLTGDPENILAHVRKTELALTRNNVEDALAAALTGVNVAPGSATAHRNLGTAYRALIRERLVKDKQEVADEIHEKALAAFDRAAELDAEEAGQMVWYDALERARVYQHWVGHDDAAVAELKRAWSLAEELGVKAGLRAVATEAVEQSQSSRDADLREWALERRTLVAPANLDVWVQLARFQALKTDPADEAEELPGLAATRRAEAVWRQAAERNPDSPIFYAQHALAIHRAGRSAEAFELLDSAPAELRNDPAIHSVRVRMNIDLHRVDDAEAAIQAFEKAHPDEPGVEIVRARLELLVGLNHQARDRLNELAGRTERADLFLLLAEAQDKVGNRSGALAAVDRAIELSTSPSYSALLMRTRLRAELEDWAGVLSSFRNIKRHGMRLGPTVRAYRVRALYETERKVPGRQELERLLEAYPESIEVVLTYVDYEGLGSPKRTRALLDRAIEAHPDSTVLILRRAEFAIATGHTDEALAVLDTHLEPHGDAPGSRPMLRLARARLLLALDRSDEAIADLESAFEGRPRPIPVPAVLATALQAQGRVDEAIEYLERARSTPPVASNAMWQLGSLYLGLGRLEQARTVLEEVVRAAPKMARARNDLAWVLADLGQDLDRALDLARSARADLPHNAAVADTLGWVYLRRKLDSAALVEFDAAIDLAEANGNVQADYFYHRGLALERLGRPRDAAGAFERALALEPEHAGARDASARVADAGSPASQG
ncbi:MAG: tetratricopeptide repeat protein [Myxococcota bacterium]